MGSTSLKITPYIEIPSQYEKGTEKMFGCKKCKETRWEDTSFCAKCGTKNDYIEIEKTYRFDYDELLGVDELIPITADYDSNITYLLPCSYLNTPNDFENFDSIDVFKEITPESIPIEIEAFKKIYADKIALLEKTFGIEIIVKFGVINWYN